MAKIGFFAYSSNPTSAGNCIEEAVGKINHMGECNIKTWTKLIIGGRILIKSILDEIDKSDFFCADLTGMNPNVLFELGYAIGKNKKIWLIFDNSIIESKRKFDEIQFLSTVGYCSYHSTQDILNQFIREKPFESGTSIFDDLISENKFGREVGHYLYVKSQYSTNYSQVGWSSNGGHFTLQVS